MSAPTDVTTRTEAVVPAVRGRDRHRLRRVLMWLGLAPALVALALMLKVGSMLYLNHSGRDDLAAGRLEPAAAAFDQTQRFNLIEPWVAPYDLGTALYRQAEYAQARDRFEAALRTVPAAEECRVRINLALAQEALGDAALADGDPAAARKAWTEGLDTLQATGCAGPTPTSDRERTAAGVAERVRGKLSTTSAPTQTTPAPAPVAADDLDRRNQRAQEQRHRKERRQDQAEQDPGRPGEAPDYQW